MSTAIAPIETFRQELRLQESNFRPLLPSSINPDKFQAIVIAAVSGNPKLLDCTRESLWKACIQGAELGLSLNPTLGEADILPVWNGRLKKNEAQFRPRYKGLMKLALQSGEVTSIRSVLVHENDEFEEIRGLREDIIHKPARGERGAMTHVYCVWNLKSQSEPQFEVMDRAQVMRIKARSSSKNQQGEIVGPWVSDEPEMWRKTVVRRASKYMPISCDAFQRAVAVDNIVEGGGEVDITEDGEIIDITAEPEVEFDDGAQVSAIEDTLPDEPEDAVAMVEFMPTDDWQTWCTRAYKVCKALPEHQRIVWLRKHDAMLEEAAQSRPTAVAHIRKLAAKEEV
jgi:recombination protein RecT